MKKPTTSAPTTVLTGLAVLCLLAVGCGPQLIVRHFDPTEPNASISIDGVPVGEVEFGDTLSVSLDEGPRRITATTTAEGRTPWSAPSNGWVVIVENDVILTLLPPKPPPPSAATPTRPTTTQ